MSTTLQWPLQPRTPPFNGELEHEHVLHLLKTSSNLGNATTTCFLPSNLNAQPFLSSLSPISLHFFLPHQPCLLYGLHVRRLLWSISWLRTRLRLVMAAISRMPPFNELYCPLLPSGKSHHVWQVWHHASHPNHTQPCSATLPQTMVGTVYIWWRISGHNHLWHHNLTIISLWGHELSSGLFLHTAQIKITNLYYYAISLQKQYVVQM